MVSHLLTPKMTGVTLLSNGKDQTAKLWDVRMMRPGDARPRSRQRQFDYRQMHMYGMSVRQRRMGTRARPASSSDENEEEGDDDVAEPQAGDDDEMDEYEEGDEGEEDDDDDDYDSEGEEQQVIEEVEGGEGDDALLMDDDEAGDELTEAQQEVLQRMIAEHNGVGNSDDEQDADVDIRQDREEDADYGTGAMFNMNNDHAYGGDSGGPEQSTPRDADDEDCSVVSYMGHRVLETLIRCRFSPAHSTGQRYVYSGSQDGDIWIYDTLTGAVVKKLSRGHDETVRDVSWHPTQPQLMSSSWDGNVIMWSKQ